MDSSDVAKIVDSVIRDSARGGTIRSFKAIRVAIPEEHLKLFDTLIDLGLANITDDPQSIVIALIHGIRTDGKWEHLVRSRLSDVPHLEVHALGYEPMMALQLWSPWRGGPVANIMKKLRDLRSQEPDAKLVVIAHSFGTYILTKILEEAPDIRIDRIIMCGSIVRNNFQWDKHAATINKRHILNDVGTRDVFPVLAKISTWGYGTSGRLGFQSNRVFDRYFNYKHSDFFTPQHVDDFWKPFILKNTIVSSEWDLNRPATSTCMLSMMMFGRLFFVALYLGILYGLYSIGSGAAKSLLLG